MIYYQDAIATSYTKCGMRIPYKYEKFVKVRIQVCQALAFGDGSFKSVSTLRRTYSAVVSSITSFIGVFRW